MLNLPVYDLKKLAVSTNRCLPLEMSLRYAYIIRGFSIVEIYILCEWQTQDAVFNSDILSYNTWQALVDISEGKIRHVPYRDSKLTFLLKACLPT